MPIYEYHGGPRFDFDRTDPSVLGLEIECYVKSDVDLDTFIQECMDIGGITPERDGSLDYNRGVEFIFKPVPFSQLTGSHIEKWANLATGQVKAWKQSRYGMHISMNIGPWSRLHTSAFKNFVNENQPFFEKMAGREANGFCSYVDEDYHGSAVSRYEGRMEVRIFQSSSNFRRISLNCQLLDSLRNYLLDERLSRVSLKRFKQFSIQNTETHPLLASYFQGAYYAEPVSQV